MKKIVLLTASVAISISTLISVELLLIIFHHAKAPLHLQAEIPEHERMFRLDPELIYSFDYHENNTMVSVNDGQAKYSFPFRPDHIPNTDLTDGTTKILVIGDSFTYGHYIDDDAAFPAQLEKMLLDYGLNINVLNAGVPGYGVDQEYVQILQYIPYIKPDVIVLNLNENDMYDSNDNCLFRQSTKNRAIGFEQVSGRTSSMYIQLLAREKLPDWAFGSNLFDLVMRSVRLANRWNYLCTMPEGGHMMTSMKYKIVYLLSDLSERLSGMNIKLFITIMPSQSNFIKNRFVKPEADSLVAIKEAADLSGLEVTNFNYVFEEYEKTSGAPADALLSTELAESVRFSAYNDLFLSREADSEAGEGSRHLNSRGAEVVARVLFGHIVAYISETANYQNSM